MSAESKSPEEYRSALESEELDKLTKGLSKLQVSNEKPLMHTFPVKSERGATQSKRGKSVKGLTVNVQAASRKRTEAKAKNERGTRKASKRTAVNSGPPENAANHLPIPNVLPPIPEGTRRTRGQTRRVLEKAQLAQKKGVKARSKKAYKTFQQRARNSRRAKVAMKRTGVMQTLQALKKEERSRKAKEAAAKTAATKAEKEAKKQEAIEKGKATKASKKDTEMK
jgi:hypothetical protein